MVAALYAGFIGTEGPLADVLLIIRVASFAAFGLALASYAAWRWIPLAQNMTFPYLGGRWSGRLHFTGPNGSGNRAVTLDIRHTLLKIELVMDSKESTSRTLVVQAQRDPAVNQDRLYYVYSNERKEGVADAGSRYRGLA